MQDWVTLGVAALTGAFAAGGAWVAVRIELRYMKADIRDLKIKVERLGRGLRTL